MRFGDQEVLTEFKKLSNKIRRSKSHRYYCDIIINNTIEV